MAIKTVET